MRPLLFLLAVLPITATATDVTLTHQGRLLDAAGGAVNGATTVTIEFWASQSSTDAADRLDTQDHGIHTEDGYFSVQLTAQSEWFSGDVWVEYRMNGAALGGRQHIDDVPVATVSRTSQGVTVSTSSPSTPCADGSLVLDQSGTQGVLRVCSGDAWLPPVPTGLTADSSAADCAAIHSANPSAPDGTYWITPNNELGAIPVYCDMTTADGGWTLCLNSRYTGAAARLFNDNYHKIYTDDPFSFYDWCPTTRDEYLFTLADDPGDGTYDVKTATVHLQDARPSFSSEEFTQVGITAPTSSWTWLNTPDGLNTACTGNVNVTFYQFISADFRGLNGYKRGWLWCTVSSGSNASGVSLVMGTGCNYASCPRHGTWPFTHQWDSNVFPTWSAWTMRLVATAGNGNNSWKAGPFEEDRTLIFYR